jgi:hypothetical protein
MFTWQGATPVVNVPGGSGVPRHQNGDGKYEDINSNARKDISDIVLYHDQRIWIR